MSDGLAKNDPYKGMETAEKDIRPEFLQSTDKQKEREEKSGKAAAGLGAAEKMASGALGKGGGGVAGAVGGVAGGMAGGLFSGVGKMAAESKKGKGKGKFGVKASAGVVLILGLMLAAVAINTIGSPMFLIGALDFNLQRALGFSGTVGILEKQAEYVTGEMLSKGEVPDGYAGDLAAAGITVGQVTAAGDFVRTNTYVAEVDKLGELAVVGSGFQTVGGEGELAVLFDGKVTAAEDFAEAVEADPRMYAAYSEAANISAKFYYSDSVDKVYQDMEIPRDLFTNWTATGDNEKDMESFNETITEFLNKKSDLTVNGYGQWGCHTETVTVEGENGSTTETRTVCNNNFTENVSSKEEASGIVDSVANKTEDASQDVATDKAAQLLNTAISAGEPYMAARSFMAIEEPLQQARIEGKGPANQVMTLLNEENAVKYTDVATGKEKELTKSILTTENFAAAVSDGTYSTAEAVNFSRDRAITAVNMNSNAIIKDTTLATDGQKKSNMVISISPGSSANRNTLNVVEDGVSKAMVEENSALMPSAVGGNRAVEGGSFISNSINLQVLGAMPSDEKTIMAYHQEVEEVLARKAEAERATLSPFDVSSPNTFMGSIVHGLAVGLVQSRAKSGGDANIVGMFGAAAELAGDSVKELWGTVVADDKSDSYETTFGDYCETVGSAAKVKGDIYCTSHNTVSTGYMKRTKEDWQKALGDDLDDSGSVNKDGDLGDFVTMGMDRKATVGVKNAEVCEKWKEKHGNALSDIGDALSNLVGLYDSCRITLDVSGQQSELDAVATGERYTMSSENSKEKKVKAYSGFTLYDTVSSLLSGNKSEVTAFREEYYKEHPLDNSAAGKLARISGLSRAEAQIALDYSAYLTEIARYDATDRYVFGDLEIERKDLLSEHANELAVDLYCLWSGRVRYADVRNRTFVM